MIRLVGQWLKMKKLRGKLAMKPIKSPFQQNWVRVVGRWLEVKEDAGVRGNWLVSSWKLVYVVPGTKFHQKTHCVFGL